jgi:hypothetical protein
MTTIIPGNPWFLETLQNATFFEREEPEWVNANTMVNYTGQVRNENANRVKNYNAQFDSYARQKSERPEASNIVPPPVPSAQAVQLDMDGTPVKVETAKPLCTARVWTPTANTLAHGIAATSDPLLLFLANANVGEPFSYGGKIFTRTS